MRDAEPCMLCNTMQRQVLVIKLMIASNIVKSIAMSSCAMEHCSNPSKHTVMYHYGVQVRMRTPEKTALPEDI